MKCWHILLNNKSVIKDSTISLEVLCYYSRFFCAIVPTVLRLIELPLNNFRIVIKLFLRIILQIIITKIISSDNKSKATNNFLKLHSVRTSLQSLSMFKYSFVFFFFFQLIRNFEIEWKGYDNEMDVETLLINKPIHPVTIQLKERIWWWWWQQLRN